MNVHPNYAMHVEDDVFWVLCTGCEWKHVVDSPEMATRIFLEHQAIMMSCP